MSGSDSASTWSSLLSDLQPSEDITLVYSEAQFHQSFVQACAEVRERDPQRSLARFLRYHDQVIVFVAALDESTGLDSCHSLSSVFWSMAFATVRAALKSQQKAMLFSQYLPKLNNLLPAFGAELSAFPDVEKVQRPLQRIFAIYIECYTVMRNQILQQTAPADLESFLEKVNSASQDIVLLREEWETTVKEAADELAAKKFLLSQPSYPNGTLGPLDPHTTRAAFDWQETLGQGTYGVVSKVRETSTGTIYAQKVIRVTDSRLRSRVEKEVLNEVSIMQKLRHHHIASVQFYVREADTFSIIMLPVADCDLLHFLQRRCIDAQFPRSELAHLNSWFGCLVGALAFAHSNDIKHEDIKPSNILIKGDQPFLADFGCAKDFSGLESSSSIETLTFGTPVYWAPESHPRGRSADIFSLGCVFTEMLTVRHGQTLEDYQAFRYLPERDNAYAFRENLSQVLRWLENLVDPKDSVGTLLKEETLKMLEPDKTRRKTAKEIKRGLRLEGDIVFCSTCF